MDANNPPDALLSKACAKPVRGAPCGSTVFEGADECILHLDEPNKSLSTFAETFLNRLRSSDFRLDHVVFPLGFSFPSDELIVSRDREWLSFTGCVFYDKLVLDGVDFHTEVYFSDSVFKADVAFRGVQFRDKADFGHVRFEGYAEFRSARFYKGVDFMAATFAREASFDGVEFPDVADFGSARFLAASNFYAAKFLGDAYFNSTQFSMKTNFIRAHFGGRAEFQHSAFLDADASNFMRCVFVGHASFMSLNVVGTLDIRESKFKLGAVFVDSHVEGVLCIGGNEYAGNVLLDGLAGTGYITFAESTFRADVNMRRAMLTGHFSISGSTFEGESQFYESEFNSCYFERCMFSKRASFGNVVVSGEAAFTSSKFKEDLALNGAVFRGKLEFDAVELSRTLVVERMHLGSPTILAHTNLEHMVFRGVDLSGCLFSHAVNIEKAEFDGVIWATWPRAFAHIAFALSEERGLVRRDRWDWWTERQVSLRRWSRLAVADEVRARTGLGPLANPRSAAIAAERVYRGVRASYESRKDHPRTGDFYFGEMEMRRLAGSASPLRPNFDPLTPLYGLLSGYGERWWKALFWFAVLCAACAVFYLATGLWVKVPAVNEQGVMVTRLVAIGAAVSPPCPDVRCYAAGFWDALLHSVLVATFLGRDVYALTDDLGGQVIQTVEALLGPLLLALMALAVRRRFQR